MTVETVIEGTVSVETTEALVEIAIEEMITTGKLKKSNILQTDIILPKNSHYYQRSLKHLYNLQR